MIAVLSKRWWYNKMFGLLTWVFTLLYQVRYRRPVTQVLFENYGQETLKDFRILQKLQLQRDKSLCDLEFLTKCKIYGVIPKFLYFRSSVKNFHSSKLYLSILHKSLNFEIRNKQKKSAKLGKEYQDKLGLFKNRVSWFDYKVLLSRLTRDNDKKIKNVKYTHSKKLTALGVTKLSEINPDNVIFNLSSRVLSKEEKI